MCELLERLARAESPSRVPDAAPRGIRRPRARAGGDRVPRQGSCRAVSSATTSTPVRWSGAHGAPYQLLVGHLDTVWPVGTIETMPVRLDDGELRGPGVVDMKGGLVQMVFALARVERARPRARLHAGCPRRERRGDRQRRLSAAARAPRAGSYPRVRARAGVRAGREAQDRAQGRRALPGDQSPAGPLMPASPPSRGCRRSSSSRIRFSGSVRAERPETGDHRQRRHDRRRPASKRRRARGDRRRRRPGADARGRSKVEAAIRGLQPVEAGAVILVEGGFGRPPMEPTQRNLELFRHAQAGRRAPRSARSRRPASAEPPTRTSRASTRPRSTGSARSGTVHTRSTRGWSSQQLPERAALLAAPAARAERSAP